MARSFVCFLAWPLAHSSFPWFDIHCVHIVIDLSLNEEDGVKSNCDANVFFFFLPRLVFRLQLLWNITTFYSLPFPFATVIGRVMEILLCRQAGWRRRRVVVG